MLALARLSPLLVRIADAYARWLRPFGPLRRRVILMLAILENAPDTAPELNSARVGSRTRVLAGVVASLLGSVLCLLAGLLLLGPLHLVSALVPER
jgi:hypothetical protein